MILKRIAKKKRMINEKDFIHIYAETYQTTIKEAEKVCANVFQLLKRLMYKEGREISFYKFGSFKQKTLKAKRVRHPITKEILTTQEKKVIKFCQTDSPF